MKFYYLSPPDPKGDPHLIFNGIRKSPWLVIKPRYKRFQCACGKIDFDGVFEEGFDSDVKIREKGDFVITLDGFTLATRKVVETIEEKQFYGLSWKAISNADWYVLNVVERVPGDEGAYDRRKPVCKVCSRAKVTVGLIVLERQIAVGKVKGAFFSTTFDRGGSLNGNREIFATEDVLVAFRDAGIKGVTFNRLATEEEESAFKAAKRAGKIYIPPKDRFTVLK